MKLSILTVSLNSGEKLLETVKTVFRQTYEDWEIVVKDGGSKDNSLQQLRDWLQEQPSELQRKVRICEEKDSSIYDGMNQAAALAAGEYYTFLNCGDLLYSEDSLKQLMEGIDSHPGSKIYYGNVFDALRGSVIPSNPHMDDFACYRNLPCHQACVYNRVLFEKRGYRPEYRIRADYEFFLWAYFKEDANPCYLDVVLSSYEGGGFSETKENRKRSAREHKEIVEQYMSKAALFKYRAILLLTLQPLRTAIAENKVLGKWYQKAKNLIYH